MVEAGLTRVEWQLSISSYRGPQHCDGLRAVPDFSLHHPFHRYRQRYLDLIVNPHVKDVFLKRGLRDGIFSSSGIAGN